MTPNTSKKPAVYNPADYYNPPMESTRQAVDEVSTNFGGQQITGRALSHQLLTNVPRYLRESAFKSDFVDLLYYANSLAGTHTAEVDIDIPFAPQIIVWRLGATDRDGVVMSDTGGMVLGSCDLAIGGTCEIEWNKDTLTFTATTLNVGWPVFITEHFYYMVLNDDARLSDFGV